MNIFSSIILAVFLTCLPVSAVFAAESSTFGNFEVGLPGVTGSIDTFVNQDKPIVNFVGVAISAVIAVLVIIGVICIVIGGYVYMTAGGDASRVKLGKEMIVAALAGIFLALISVIILNTINSYLGTDAVEPKLDISGAGGGGNGGGAGNNAGNGAGGNLGGGNSGAGGGGGVNNQLPNSQTNANALAGMGLTVPQSLVLRPNDLVMLENGNVLFQGNSYSPTDPRIGQDLRAAGVTNSDEVRLYIHENVRPPTMVSPFKGFLSNSAGIPFENIITPQLNAADPLRGQFITGS